MRVNTTDLQNAFGKYLSLSEKEDVVVVKNGKSVAKLISFTEPDFFLVHEEKNNYQSIKKISYEEYMNLVNSSDQRYELIDGEIYLLASPSFKHQIVVNEIAWHFNNFFREKPCRSLTAPLEVKLFSHAAELKGEPNVVHPDVVVISDVDKVNEESKYEGIPTLIVEVLSPSTKGKDMAIKLHLYMKSGILEYWIADFEKKCIIQYSFSEERDIKSYNTYQEEDMIKSTVFEDLQIPLREIFLFKYI